MTVKDYEIKCCGIVRNLVESVRFCDILDKTQEKVCSIGKL